MSLHSFIHSCHYTCCCVRDSDITGDRKLVTGNSLYIGGCCALTQFTAVLYYCNSLYFGGCLQSVCPLLLLHCLQSVCPLWGGIEAV